MLESGMDLSPSQNRENRSIEPHDNMVVTIKLMIYFFKRIVSNCMGIRKVDIKDISQEVMCFSNNVLNSWCSAR